MNEVLIVKTGVTRGLYDEVAFHCPVCRKELIPKGKYGIKTRTELNYCDNCGSKLDWSNTGVAEK